MGTAGREGGGSVKRIIAVPLLALAMIAGGVATLVVGDLQASAVAQDATADAMATHPIVGTWLLNVDIFDENVPPLLVIYHADGTYTDAGAGRGSGIGVWEPIDENTVAANVLFHTQDEEGNFGLTRIRTETTVDESGDAYTSEYTRELIAADGTSTGELGPGSAMAERITVEPRGEPVGPMAGA